MSPLTMIPRDWRLIVLALLIGAYIHFSSHQGSTSRISIFRSAFSSLIGR